MRRTLAAISAVLVFSAAAPALAQSSDLEKRFDAQISTTEMDAWMKDIASQPNHVGSVHDKANAEALAARFKSWGWDTKIETFSVLYPTPITVGLN